jgi:hypothetical protein
MALDYERRLLLSTHQLVCEFDDILRKVDTLSAVAVIRHFVRHNRVEILCCFSAGLWSKLLEKLQRLDEERSEKCARSLEIGIRALCYVWLSSEELPGLVIRRGITWTR